MPASSPKALEQGVAALSRGEVIAFPTDTVYGIGAHAFLRDAVARLYVVKERPTGQALPVLLPDAEALDELCSSVPSLAWELARRFWPGGLSLILLRKDTVPDEVTGGGPTVAVRVPDEPLVRELCRRLGAPIANTSANRHGWPTPVTAEQVREQLEGRLSLILDGGACPGGVASTVLDLTVSPPAILRPGPVTAAELQRHIPGLHAS